MTIFELLVILSTCFICWNLVNKMFDNSSLGVPKMRNPPAPPERLQEFTGGEIILTYDYRDGSMTTQKAPPTPPKGRRIKY